jgi:hypothetical protein
MVMCNSGRPGENPEIQHWGLLLNEIQNIIVLLKSLQIPAIFIAHEMVLTLDESTVVRIALPGQKLPGAITRLFTEIWYMRIRQTGQGKSEIYLQTSPTSSVTCRSGRGLKSGERVATIDPKNPSMNSVSMWNLLETINWRLSNDEVKESV